MAFKKIYIIYFDFLRILGKMEETNEFQLIELQQPLIMVHENLVT